MATDYDHGESYHDYVISGIPLRVYFRIFDRKRIYELLNIVNQKDYSKEELTNFDHAKIMSCIIFSKKPYAKDVIEKCVRIFISVENMNYNHQVSLFWALKMAIKNVFKDDIEKIRELLTMITKAVNKSKMEELATCKPKIIDNDKLRRELSQKDEVISQIKEENEKLREVILRNNLSTGE